MHLDSIEAPTRGSLSQVVKHAHTWKQTPRKLLGPSLRSLFDRSALISPIENMLTKERRCAFFCCDFGVRGKGTSVFASSLVVVLGLGRDQSLLLVVRLSCRQGGIVRIEVLPLGCDRLLRRRVVEQVRAVGGGAALSVGVE